MAPVFGGADRGADRLRQRRRVAETADDRAGRREAAMLTPAEVDVLQRTADGYTAAMIAAVRGTSVRTVRQQRRMILLRLEVPTAAAAVARGLRMGIIE